tara:strand:- start:11 stop:274 length:264 start_codon:yes stop_codon:yes gene_type:complete
MEESTAATIRYTPPPQLTARPHRGFLSPHEPLAPGQPLDIQSGEIIQRAHLDLKGAVIQILVDGDELFISEYSASKVMVFQLAGSEA